MNYTCDEVLQYVAEENIKFIRLAFCDVYGRQKNISIMPPELPRAFETGIAMDASAIAGFGGDVWSDLLLHPDPSTLSSLPWRPENGGVVRMYCDITHPDGKPFAADSRRLLKNAAAAAEQAGCAFSFGAELEFYLFQTDEQGQPTQIPWDQAGYMDVAPMDRGENIRREVCLTLEQMGICPESSHHEEGPGQNEIDFRYSDPLTAADNTISFRNIVETIAMRNGLWADFSPKPLQDHPGSGFHINLSVSGGGGIDPLPATIAGILEHIYDITLFLNPLSSSYDRLGGSKAPGYITWSPENRSQLIRIPAAHGAYRRAELRSPDPSANPYIAFALLIYAGLDGINRELYLPPPAIFNLYSASSQMLEPYRRLPTSREEAAAAAAASGFVADQLPAPIRSAYLR